MLYLYLLLLPWGVSVSTEEWKYRSEVFTQFTLYSWVDLNTLLSAAKRLFQNYQCGLKTLVKMNVISAGLHSIKSFIYNGADIINLSLTKMFMFIEFKWYFYNFVRCSNVFSHFTSFWLMSISFLCHTMFQEKEPPPSRSFLINSLRSTLD